MSEVIEKKIRSAKVFRIVLILLLVLCIGSFALMGIVDEIEIIIAPVMLSMNAFWISGVVYYASYHPFVSSVKWLEGLGLRNVADDIVLDRPTLPRSKIYCGQWALFCKKPCVIIPYAQIAWVHLYEQRAYGIAIEKAVIIYTKDGKKFTLNANADEFKWLLENYIIPQSPNIILGYGAEQKARYKQLNPETANMGKKAKRIWGIILMAWGAFLLVVALVNQTLLDPAAVIILGVLAAGIALFLSGKKK